MAKQVGVEVLGVPLEELSPRQQHNVKHLIAATADRQPPTTYGPAIKVESRLTVDLEAVRIKVGEAVKIALVDYSQYGRLQPDQNQRANWRFLVSSTGQILKFRGRRLREAILLAKRRVAPDARITLLRDNR